MYLLFKGGRRSAEATHFPVGLTQPRAPSRSTSQSAPHSAEASRAATAASALSKKPSASCRPQQKDNGACRRISTRQCSGREGSFEFSRSAPWKLRHTSAQLPPCLAMVGSPCGTPRCLLSRRLPGPPPKARVSPGSAPRTCGGSKSSQSYPALKRAGPASLCFLSPASMFKPPWGQETNIPIGENPNHANLGSMLSNQYGRGYQTS